MKNSFLRGTFMMTAAAFIVKIFGFIYVVPFVAMVGQHRYILFEYAYKPYIILLSIATLGIPSAVAKFVSKYREKEDYHIIRALFRSATIIITIMGILAFLLLYFGSDTIASWLIDPNDKTGNSLQDVAYVIKMVSYALIIVPLLALTRGFIQGYQEMETSAMSQIIEQIIRIVIILFGTYFVVEVVKGSPVTAVGIATFSAFISAMVALVVVFWHISKHDYKIKNVKGKVSYKKLYLELVKYAVPFVFVGLSIPIFQSIDTFMINKILMSKGLNLGQAETINSIVALIQKIVVIPVALATAFSVSLVTYVTQAHQGNRIDEVRSHINQSFKVNMYFVLPSVAGMLVLARPIYGAVYGTTFLSQGGNIMAWYAGTAIVYSMFSITSAILQGLDQQKWVVVSLILGIVIKILSNFPLITIYNGDGTAISTYLGFIVAIVLQMYLIQKVGKYKWSENLNSIKNIGVQTLVMALALMPLGITSLFFTKYIYQAILLLLGLSIAGIIYFTLSYKNKTLFEVIGKSKVDKVLKKIKLVR